jgi:hypothetical protein
MRAVGVDEVVLAQHRHRPPDPQPEGRPGVDQLALEQVPLHRDRVVKAVVAREHRREIDQRLAPHGVRAGRPGEELFEHDAGLRPAPELHELGRRVDHRLVGLVPLDGGDDVEPHRRDHPHQRDRRNQPGDVAAVLGTGDVQRAHQQHEHHRARRVPSQPARGRGSLLSSSAGTSRKV